MNNDLISREALRKNMEFICMGIMAGTEPYNAPLTEIDNAPSVDIKEAYEQGYTDGWKERFGEPDGRPHGEWIVIHNALGETKYQCDQCKHYIKSSDDKNFCPNCGASMKGGAE